MDYIILATGEIIPGTPAASFAVVPNPAEKEVELQRLTTDASIAVELCFFDLYGHALASYSLGKGEISAKIEIAGLPPGIYFIRFQSGGQIIQTSKLIKM